MSPAKSFGRRQPAAAAPPAQPPPRPAPRPAQPAVSAAPSLSPQAEAFRAELAAERRSGGSEFDRWRRSGGRRWLVWGLTLLSFSPGVVSFLIDAPLPVSGGLEVAAFVGNIWLRRERRRRLHDIATWEEPAEPA
jgi:hypothetical protein